MALSRRNFAAGAALAAACTGTSREGAAQGWPAVAAEADLLVPSVLKAFDVPGVALAVVENGAPVLAKGYGVRGLKDSRPVDAHTIFAIASNTKAFTAAAIATLIDDAKLSWDDRVTEKLPGFEMWDPWVTRELTVRDLLVHRSGLGLGEGDLMLFPKNDFTPAELVAHLRYLKPKTSFRSAYAYDNVLYVAAGELVAAVTGSSWSERVRSRLFRPSGIGDATIGESAFYAAPNHAWPHAKLGGPDRGFGGALTQLDSIDVGDLFLAEGAIAASASDLQRWLLVQIGGGQAPGGPRVFSAAQGREMWTPQTLIPMSDGPGGVWPPSTFSAYGLGWDVTDADGERVVRHGGYVDGFKSLTFILPDRKSGFVILTNAEEGYAIYAIALSLLDLLRQRPRVDHIAPMLAARARNAALARAAAPEMTALPDAKPSLPLSAYAGVYRDNWYGTMTVRMGAGGLTLSMDRTPVMAGALQPWRYDTFRTRWPAGVEDAFVSFSLSPEGEIAGARMKAVSALADFSFDYQDLAFTRVAGPQGKPT